MARLNRFKTIVINYLRALAIPLAAFLLFTGIGLSSLLPPAPRESGNENEFSVNRTVEHVQKIASEPHPVGSAAHGRVLTYLVEQLRALPLDVQLQDALVRGVRLTNVLARPKNSTGTNIILLVAHYDSVPTGPGAGDDGAGVATLLETARVLSREPAAKNEIAFLFTDSEEGHGLAGSAAFVRNNAEFLKRVRVVLNFEARGNSGPVTMFETGPNNLELIRLFRTCPYPMGTSFAQDVYRRMPNDTDFSNFLRAGHIGYNFAVIMGVEHYHRPTDTPENLSRRSLAHYGSYAVPLARKLASADPDSLRASQDAVFFPPIRGLLVVYPASWASPLAIVAFIIFSAVLIPVPRKRLGVGRFLLSVAATIAVVALMIIVGIAYFKLVTTAFGNHWFGLRFTPMASHSVVLICLFLTVLVVLAIKHFLSRKIGSADILAGALTIWLPIAIFAAICAWPGFSYLPLWPTIFGVVALAILVRTNQSGKLTEIAAMLCTLVPCCLLFAPTMLLSYHALGMQLIPVLVGLVAMQVFLIHVPASAVLSTGRNAG